MKFKTNKITDIREHYFVELNKMFPANETASLLDMIFEKYLALTRINRQLNPDYRLSESEILKVHFAVKSLMKNIPIQYIFNQSNFYGLDFYVDESVLIPRPETEELVEWIIKDHKHHDGDLKILDIGTGSGCIAIALKKFLPLSEVWAVDVSAAAIDVATRNAESNNVKINFMQQDILCVDKIVESNFFEIIVSNPPYVRESEKSEMLNNVLNNEPAQALFVEDADPLLFYRRIAEIGRNSLSSSGSLYLEINQYLGGETKGLLVETGFKEVILRQDLNGNDRMIRAQKK